MPTPQTWPQQVHICIPAYNASAPLKKLLRDLRTIVPLAKTYVVNDGSTDDTLSICKEAGIHYQTLKKNKGKGFALACGIQECIQTGAQWIITLDSDGQHSLNDLPVFLAAIAQNPPQGILIGARARSLKTMPLARIFSNTVTSYIISRFTGTKILDCQSGYRAYSAAFMKSFTIEYDRFEMETEVILKACRLGFGVGFVPIQTVYAGEKSNIAHIADTFRWVRAVVTTHHNLKRNHVS